MEPLAADSRGLKWLYGSAFLFALTSCIALAEEFYWIFLIPIVLLVVVTGFYRVDLLMLFAVAVTPLSINLAKTSLGIGVSLPSEPIIFGIMLLYFFKMIMDDTFDKKVLLHPVSLAIIFHLLWMLVTSLTSSMPLVSLKATLARFCFVIVFFYLCSQVFRRIKMIRIFAWCYIIPLLIVVGYTSYIHAMAGFTEKAAHTAMVPFYNDHTAYAAVIAMFIPITLGFAGDKESSRFIRIFSFIAFAVFITAIVLSYTRASWISLVAALVCYLILLLRIKTSIVVGGIAAFVIFLFIYWTQITMTLERTDKQSSTDYASHVESMSNITTDASNVERLNRWQSAFRMWFDRPLFGWGPGTYMFQYAPYQKWSERTIISTNFGEGGNAHSEYIGPLSEQGIPGPLAFILIGALVIFGASRIIINSKNPKVNMLAKSLLLGLITYWVHGFLNNFLDTEKASVPFWAFIAGLVALEMYHHQSKPGNGKEVSVKSDT